MLALSSSKTYPKTFKFGGLVSKVQAVQVAEIHWAAVILLIELAPSPASMLGSKHSSFSTPNIISLTQTVWPGERSKYR